MHKLCTTMAIAMSVIACGKQEIEKPQPKPQPTEPEVQTVTVKINAGLGESTKSVFSEMSGNTMLSEWTLNKEAKFYVGNNTAVNSAPKQSGKYTSFEVELTSATSGDLWVVSPRGTYNSSDATKNVGGFTSGYVNSNYNNLYVVVPGTQTPLSGSCDESVHMVASSMEIPSTGIPSVIDMDFHLAIAFGKLTVKNFTSTKIKQAVLTFPNAVVGKSCKFQLASGIIDNASDKVITLLGDNITKDENGNFVFWFGLVESTHNSGSFVVELTDEEDVTYSKTVSLSSTKALSFTTGHIKTINVDMNGQGSNVSEGTVLWSETWTGGSTDETPSAYGFEGTTTYKNQTVSYSAESANTKLYDANLAGGTAPELLISSGTTWTVDNIPTAYAGTMTLTFKSNRTNLEISSSTDGVLVSGSGSEWTIVNTAGAENISLTFKANSNARIDDIQLVWSSSEAVELDIEPAATVSASHSGVGSTAADLGGSYSSVSGTVTEVGFEWGIGQLALNNKVMATKGSNFSYAITGLTANTTYYYRAYVKVKGSGTYASTESTFYSSTYSFTTSASTVTTSKLIYGACMEFPAVNPTLSANQSYTATGYEYYNSASSSTDKWFRTSTGTSNQYIVSHTFQNNGSRVRNYHMLFDGSKKCALWVAYALNSTTWKDGNVSRNENWVYDPALDNSIQPNLSSSYKNSNLDRGHQAASNDRQTTVNMNKQTFYFSNMTPQNSTLNSGNWGTLEGKVQSAGWACSGLDTLYVVTGPIFDSGYTTTTDASSASCPVPTRYYKCLMKCTFNSSGEVTAAKGVAYLTPGNDASSNTAYSNWKTTIDAVEAITGFDFFTNVPTALQDAAEKTNGLSL